MRDDAAIPTSANPQVLSYVLQGRMAEARQMLAKWSVLKPAASGMCKQMDNLLGKMPVYNVCPTPTHIPTHIPILISD